jgi:hypothetical protein
MRWFRGKKKREERMNKLPFLIGVVRGFGKRNVIIHHELFVSW